MTLFQVYDPGRVLTGLQNQVFDFYQRTYPRVYQDTATRYVDIDEESLKRIGQWPWPRTTVADLTKRLRASGLCNTVGRGATIATPFLVVYLFTNFGIRGVLTLMIGLLLSLVVVVLAFGVESGGRSLEQMEEERQLAGRLKKA